MKKIYNKPVLEVESFVTDEIMGGQYNPDNVLSYNGTLGTGGYNDSGHFINFHSDDDNVLNSVNYSDFTGSN